MLAHVMHVHSNRNMEENWKSCQQLYQKLLGKTSDQNLSRFRQQPRSRGSLLQLGFKLPSKFVRFSPLVREGRYVPRAVNPQTPDTVWNGGIPRHANPFEVLAVKSIGVESNLSASAPQDDEPSDSTFGSPEPSLKRKAKSNA